jgi:hypothetical protein
MNVRAACDAACVRLVNLLSSVNLEGEVLDADVVVAVSSTVGWTQPDTTITRFLSHEVDDLLRAPVGRIPDLLGPSERPEQLEVEGKRPLNVGDRKIDVMDSSSRRRESFQPRCLSRSPAASMAPTTS